MQLPLDIALPPRLGRDDFLPAPANAAALGFLERWPAWPDTATLLCGPSGSGKSHLGAIWAALSGARPLGPEALAAGVPVEPGAALLLDDADRPGLPEAALFHLLNAVREQRGTILLTAGRPPDLWGLRTPDLLSRLRLATLLELGPPDDGLLQAVLVKLFADRQLAVDAPVVSYLVPRLARSLGDARRIVDALDREALTLNRRVTRPLAARVLAGLDLDHEGA